MQAGGRPPRKSPAVAGSVADVSVPGALPLVVAGSHCTFCKCLSVYPGACASPDVGNHILPPGASPAGTVGDGMLIRSRPGAGMRLAMGCCGPVAGRRSAGVGPPGWARWDFSSCLHSGGACSPVRDHGSKVGRSARGCVTCALPPGSETPQADRSVQGRRHQGQVVQRRVLPTAGTQTRTHRLTARLSRPGYPHSQLAP